jgi:CRISPR-associated protein Csd1
MSQPDSGLLPALVGYYQRLENEPNGGVAEYGFSVEKIHFQIVLETDGSLSSFDDIRLRNDKGKPIPNPLRVPDGGGRSGTGLKPFFGWDNTGYVLGRDSKGNPKRADEMFAAFRALHQTFLPELASDEGFVALCRFLDGWKPERAESLPNWEEAAGLNVVFKLRAREGYIHQGDAVREAWLRSIAQQDPKEKPVLGISLMNGEEEELARLHPQIKGVAGANTMGAAIVSFNLDAFESYGKSQSFNSPVGTRDAFRYTTALNRLLADDARRVRIGDATVVFWSDRPEGGEAEVAFRAMFGDDFPRSEQAEHGATVDRVQGFLNALREGNLHKQFRDPDVPFYILGLSPNASRLNVRYWLVGTVGQFAKRLDEHVERLEMTGAEPGDPPLVIRRLLLETVREAKDIAPQLAGEVARAVLEGLPYPRALFDSVLRRVRIKPDVNYVKAAIFKAYLIQSGATTMDSSINKQHPEPAYHCGRMLSLLEFAQGQALPSVKTGVVQRNMAVAMATPGITLGRLMRASEVGHIPKLADDLALFVRDEMQDICVKMGDRIPATLDAVRQGVFALGFYQEQCELDKTKEALKVGRFHRHNRSDRGEWMASKLEAIVANALSKKGISYLYEVRSVLKSGQNRRPDFFIEGITPSQHVYLEVLGYDGEEYDKKWIIKREAYKEIGITPEGGEQGRLAVFDWRSKWGPDPKKRIYPSDAQIYDALSRYLPALAAAEQQSTSIDSPITGEPINE